MAFLTLLRRSPRLACSTLLGLAGCLSMLGAQAATIYQCKQADGKVTFQFRQLFVKLDQSILRQVPANIRNPRCAFFNDPVFVKIARENMI